MVAIVENHEQALLVSRVCPQITPYQSELHKMPHQSLVNNLLEQRGPLIRERDRGLHRPREQEYAFEALLNIHAY